MNKKDYVKSAKVGDILNESALKDFKDQSNNRKSILKEYDGINYKIETIGTISDMKYKNSFEDKVLIFMDSQEKFNDKVMNFMENQDKFNNKVMVFMDNQNKFNDKVMNFMENQDKFNKTMLDFIKEQREFNKQVITRLDAVEQDIKDIKACPTIQKEILTIK